jgi:Protein of unknown function (DUF3108)
MLSGETGRARVMRRRWKPLAALGVAVLLLHASVLDGVAWSWRRPVPVPNSSVLQVRTVAPETVLAPPVAALAPVASPRLEPPRARPHAPTAPPTRPVVDAPPPAPGEVPVPAADAPARAEAAPPPVEAQAASTLEPASAPAEPMPVRATSQLAAAAAADRVQVPPAITIGYELRRGMLRGSAELRWISREGEYELAFDARLAGISLLKQNSVGNFDGTGIAPLRFTDQRLGREVRATNFQREAGKITFSGPTVELPLVAGTQDRLSWMVQLAGVVSADPKRREPGGEVAMAVVGVRGDLSPWVFRYVGDELVDTGLGPVTAAKFVRERRDAYDTTAEVWLDPARYHLPARALLRSGPDDEGLELRLRSVSGRP